MRRGKRQSPSSRSGWPTSGNGLAELIRKERQSNRLFTAAFAEFLDKCRQSINPNLAEAAVEEMLIQHLLTERLFRTVFNNPDFTRRNVIANEIDSVINALTSHSFSRDEFLKSLDPFYAAIERTAATISDFSQKQHFLNTVYEQFFQGYSVKVADTHGIVYTPQPIVDFMVKSVAAILEREFGRSLADEGVHIIDPFVGTGNFIVRMMREIPRTALARKYASELHCNEVMLLPYYIASMNIEHEYYDATGRYEPFEGICLVDTFDLAEDRQLPLFAPENTQRVESQKSTPMFVVIGNPPYNVGQVNENDNNKNRKYETMDRRVAETYAKDSKATNKNALARSLCEGDSLGSGSDWRGGRCCLRDQQRISRRSSLRRDAQALGRRFRRDLHPRSGRKCAQESEALRHDAQRLWHSGRCQHQLIRQEVWQGRFPN